MRMWTAAVISALAGAAGAQTIVDPRLEAVDSWIEANPAFFPNGVGLVILQDGDPIFRKTYHGFDEGAAIPIASSTKWISGLAIAEAIADPHAAEISAETRISEFVPSFLESTGADGAPDKREITLAQAFAHLSGLPSDEGGATPHRNWASTHEAAVDAIAEATLIGPVGGQIFYGGMGMSAAALAVATALGTDWTSHAEATIFAPLGMTSTDYDAFTGEAFIPTENPNPAGSIRTTLDDYTAFLSMLSQDGIASGRRVISSEAIDVMLTDYAGEGVVIERSPYAAYEAFAPGAGAFRTGFGCFIDPSRIDPELGVRWATSAGAFGTNAFIDLDRRLTGVLFTENRERWPVPGGAGAYNPSTRAFLAEIRPRIEAALPEWCGPADLVAPAGVVSAGDLAALVAGWGGSSRDLDGDGVVGAADLAILVGSWGACQ